MDSLAKSLRATVAEMVAPNATILVATSGGPDSQALLSLLADLRTDLGIDLVAAGIDHGLRPGAQAELVLAADLARARGVEFASLAVEVPSHGNLMAAARAARYGALGDHARAIGAVQIAVGHTATDQAETVLMNLCRGAALRGCGGMAPRSGVLIRPLLGVTRRDLLAYLERHDIPFAQDPSNADETRSRALVRHRILPVLRRVNPKAEASIARFAQVAQGDEAVLTGLTDQHLRRTLGPLKSLKTGMIVGLPMALRRRVLAGWLAVHGIPINTRRLTQIDEGIERKRLATTMGGRRVRLDAGSLWVEDPPDHFDFARHLPMNGEVDFPDLGVSLCCWHTVADPSIGNAARNTGRTVAFDADRLHFEMRVRQWIPGDRLRPFGLEGHIKLGDLFTNAKIPPLIRPRWPVVVHGADVAWVVGLRRSDLAPVTEGTRNVAWVGLLGDLPGVAC